MPDTNSEGTDKLQLAIVFYPGGANFPLKETRFPFPGYRNGNINGFGVGTVFNAGVTGYYWTAEGVANDGTAYVFGGHDYDDATNYISTKGSAEGRYYGYPIRCIKE
jgi:hypothetical protein